jgi:hypothetical protein
MKRMMRVKLKGERYPRTRLLQSDRVRSDGEILHPYNARRAGTEEHAAWIIQIYLPFLNHLPSSRKARSARCLCPRPMPFAVGPEKPHRDAWVFCRSACPGRIAECT